MFWANDFQLEKCRQYVQCFKAQSGFAQHETGQHGLVNSGRLRNGILGATAFSDMATNLITEFHAYDSTHIVDDTSAIKLLFLERLDHTV